MSESDQEAQQSVSRLDTSAFERFYRENVVPLVRFLVLQGASVADAAEVVQDTLSSAYQRWHSIDNPRAWSYSVASRAWIRKISSVKEDVVADPPSPLLRTAPIDGWHIRHELITTLAKLPPRQRQVMVWTLSGYKPSEIAEELRLDPDQVRSNLRLARRALDARMNDGQDTP